MKKLLYIFMMSLAVIPAYCSGATVADAGRDRVVKSGDNVVLDGSNSRSDANRKLTYRWTQVKGIKVQIGGEDTMKASFVAPAVKTYKALLFKLTVAEEDSNASDTDFVNIQVQPLAHVDENKTDTPIVEQPSKHSEECIKIPFPDKIEFNRVVSIPHQYKVYEHYIREKVIETKTELEYIENYKIKSTTHSAKGIVSSESASIAKDEEVHIYYTITEDGLYKDVTKRTNKGLRINKAKDKKWGTWSEAKHYPSGKQVSKRSVDGKVFTDVIHYQNENIITYLPYKREFAKYCRGKSYAVKYTELQHSDYGKKVKATEWNEECIVVSIDETMWTPVATFKTIRIKCIDNGKSRTDWIDSKTGLWLRHEGDDGVQVELTSFRVNN